MEYNYATGQFEWDSGHPMVYENWGDNQPDNHTFEDCVVINRNDGKWYDIPGYKSRKFICEIQVLGFVHCSVGAGSCQMDQAYNRTIPIPTYTSGCDGMQGGYSLDDNPPLLTVTGMCGGYFLLYSE
ncbi:hypothetical protein ScPMuIL_000416 [Solemya velum]